MSPLCYSNKRWGGAVRYHQLFDACLYRKFGVVEPLRSPIIKPNMGRFDSIRFSTKMDFRKFGAIEPTLFIVHLNDIGGTMDRS